MRSLLSRFLALPRPMRWQLLEAAIWLGLARAAVLALPFRWLMAALGQSPTSVEMPTRSTYHREIQQVTWAIRMISRRTPWQSNCLAQALAGQIMLQRRGISGTLYLGVKREGSNALAAHAWLRSNDLIVTGDGPLEQYAVVARFRANL